MTQPTKRIIRKPSENQALVSFRLPNALLERLDQTVEQQGSSRTGVIRSALASYYRILSGNALLVPASAKTQDQLRELAITQECPAETIAGALLKASVELAAIKSDSTWRTTVVAHAARASQVHTPSRVIGISVENVSITSPTLPLL